MSAVTMQEIVEALLEAKSWVMEEDDFATMVNDIVSRIKQHGIAPPDEWVLVPVDPTDAMQTAHDMYGDTSDWWNAVISAVIRAAAPEVSND